MKQSGKRKKKKEMRTASETFGTMLNTPIFESQAFPEENNRKECKKIFEGTVVENFPKMGEGKSHLGSRNPESPIQDKHKEKYAKTPFNHTNKT